jgi:hypothetical protein
MTKNWKKITVEKTNFLGSKTTIYLSLGPPLRTFKLQKKPSALKREHPTLQNMKFLNFFVLLCVNFVLLDPDSESGSGSTDPIESGSHWDPDPQP